MIEHKHWKRKSTDGIEGQHIAIVGYSHYGDPQKDSDRFTHWALNKFIAGEPIGDQFFPPIQSYFGYDGRPDFWNHVDFFNFIPECFASVKKFATGDRALVERSQKRFLKILQREKPDKVFVFSRKGWNQCPYTEEEKLVGHCNHLKSDSEDTWGTYDLGGHTVQACGLRHPLYADAKRVRRSVQEFLDL
jgi:hypothetical protein